MSIIGFSVVASASPPGGDRRRRTTTACKETVRKQHESALIFGTADDTRVHVS